MTTAVGQLASQRFRRPPGTIIEPLRGLDDGRGAEGFFGIAATPGRSEPRLIDPDTALLLYSLDEPGVLPYFAAVDLLRHNARELLVLIAAGLIEIELDGAFVSGDVAMRDLVVLPDQTSKVAELNRSVMRHALRTTGTSGATTRPSALREALYFANAEPDDGTQVGVSVETTSFGRWTVKPHDAWTMFHRTSQVLERITTGGWKMYFSPRSTQLSGLLCDIADSFDQCRAAQWKVGRHAQGVLRPDKVVGYFATRNDLMAATSHFVDPKRVKGDPVSWRFALCELVAGWLASTDPDAPVAERVDRALRMSAAEGFDTETFEPPPLWLQEAEVAL